MQDRPGTTDGTGRYVTEAADDEGIRATDNLADYRNDSGHILDGPEFLTVFDGQPQLRSTPQEPNSTARAAFSASHCGN